MLGAAHQLGSDCVGSGLVTGYVRAVDWLG